MYIKDSLKLCPDVKLIEVANYAFTTYERNFLSPLSHVLIIGTLAGVLRAPYGLFQIFFASSICLFYLVTLKPKMTFYGFMYFFHGLSNIFRASLEIFLPFSSYFTEMFDRSIGLCYHPPHRKDLKFLGDPSKGYSENDLKTLWESKINLIKEYYYVTENNKVGQEFKIIDYFKKDLHSLAETNPYEVIFLDIPNNHGTRAFINETKLTNNFLESATLEGMIIPKRKEIVRHIDHLKSTYNVREDQILPVIFSNLFIELKKDVSEEAPSLHSEKAIIAKILDENFNEKIIKKLKTLQILNSIKDEYNLTVQEFEMLKQQAIDNELKKFGVANLPIIVQGIIENNGFSELVRNEINDYRAKANSSNLEE